MEGYQTLRQLGFGLLDMAYHTQPKAVQDIKTFETKQTEKCSLYPVNAETAISPSFSHIFQGGYSAGILFLQMGGSPRCGCFPVFQGKWDFQF